jgi:hypothetical protein
MITMLSNSLIPQHNVNSLACHITMKVVSEDFSYSMVGWGARARAACAEVSTGSVEASKANHGQPRLQVPYGTRYTRKIIISTFTSFTLRRIDHLHLHLQWYTTSDIQSGIRPMSRRDQGRSWKGNQPADTHCILQDESHQRVL